MSFSLLICRRCSSAPFCLLHCCVSDVSPRGRGFDSALPRLLQKVCHNSSSSSCFVCLNVYTYTRMSILQSFPSESRGGEGRMLSERKMKWKMCRFGHNWSVFTFHNHKHALNLKHWTKKNTWMKCVQAWKAYLTFLPVFSPLRKAFVCGKSAVGSPTCDVTSADVQKSLLCCSLALNLYTYWDWHHAYMCVWSI